MKTALKTMVAAMALATATTVPAYARACTPGQTGVTPDCPIYNEPVTTALQTPSIGESVTSPGAVAFTLFNGKVPVNGFMVSVSSFSFEGDTCWVNDNKLADAHQGFLIAASTSVNALGGVSNTFVTPPGYKPIGPVTVLCVRGGITLETRAW